MDDKWWHSFQEKSDNFNIPCLFENFITPEKEKLEDLLIETLQGLSGLDVKENKLRVYKGNTPDGSYFQKVIDTPPHNDETMSEWAKRLFGEEKIGIIINNAERYNENLTQAAISYVKPVLDILGVPLNGMDVTYFIGNYGYTPFGIHKDNKGEKVFHFHLGPATKNMYVWDEKTQASNIAQNIEVNFDNTELMIPLAQKFEINPGDLFFLPANLNHLGETNELSIGMTIGFHHPTNSELLQLMFDRLKHDLIRQDDTLVSPYQESSEHELRLMESFEQTLLVGEEIPLNYILKDYLADYKFEILSGLGFGKPFISEVEPEEIKGKKICLVKPFQIYFCKKNEQHISIFIRRNKIDTLFHPALPEIFDTINEGKPIQSEELIQPLLEEWDEEAGYYILSLLASHGGISILN